MVFSLRHMSSFTSATPLSDRVTISLSNEANLVVVEYTVAAMGHVRFFLLAPKVEEDEEQEEEEE